MSVTERLQAIVQLGEPLNRCVTNYPHQTGIKTFWLTERHGLSGEKQSFSLWTNSGLVSEVLKR